MDFQKVIEGVKAVLPTLKFVASITPTKVDDEVIKWLDLFVSDPKSAFEAMLGENGDKIRAGLSAILPFATTLVSHWPQFQPVVDFLSYLVTDHQEAIKSAGF